MKKFLLYSSVFTGITIIVGIFFVYGVFDLNEGRSQLIGSLHASSSKELNLHNRIVESVHGIGIQAGDANKTLQSFEEGSDFAPFASIVDTVASNKDSLDSIFEKNSFDKGIKEGYEDIYRPALENWLNSCKKMMPKEVKPKEPVEDEEEVKEQAPVIIQPTAEEIQKYKDELNAVQQMYIGAHNEYVDILNKERQY